MMLAHKLVTVAVSDQLVALHTLQEALLLLAKPVEWSWPEYVATKGHAILVVDKLRQQQTQLAQGNPWRLSVFSWSVLQGELLRASLGGVPTSKPTLPRARFIRLYQEIDAGLEQDPQFVAFRAADRALKDALGDLDRKQRDLQKAQQHVRAAQETLAHLAHDSLTGEMP
jgi:hypothetical protein